MTGQQRVALAVLVMAVQRLVREGKEPTEPAVRKLLTFPGLSPQETEERINLILREARAAMFGEVTP